MGKPRMIILVRHAQSEGNKNRDIHQTTPDHRVKLTPEGHRQAQEAGRRLRDLLRPDDTLHFFTSPYRRTRETTEGMLESLTSDSPSPSPFQRHAIKVYEEPRLREQDFGNFQPCSKEMERMWMERADYGHFFYRIPNGESAADAYDRVSGFNESLWRLFNEEDFASVCVLVTHGLMTRVFLMKWYHWSVEYFEDLRNINHCEFVIMTHNPDNGKYTLENKLRTWSDLRKERSLEKQRERAASGLDPASPTSPVDHIPIRRKWGGCPDGCTHGLSPESKRSLRTHVLDSMHHENGHSRGITNTHPEQPSPLKNTSTTSDSLDAPFTCSEDHKSPQDTENSTNAHGPIDHNSQSNKHLAIETLGTYGSSQPSTTNTNSAPVPRRPNLHDLHRDSDDHLLHRPISHNSTASINLALLHLGGRDGGGSRSGANSLAPSDDETDDVHPPAASSNTSASPPGLSHPYQSLAQQPSQDLSSDGDDELSTHPAAKTKRRPHHHHHHHYQPHPHHHTHHRHSSSTASQPHRMANILGDGDDGISTQDEAGAAPDETSLEAEQREDQSIQGSVY
ncbi:hypothetical protein N7462_006516 [Penicillium macrosclerotiorum]|uniref:uncharacterized protein n=1 Tax=Penicillium macrosclerotiorum TaxID=303699 RepID=UPI002548ABB0|nr:uncharacterized protein N7462_006516 [Penicillium macrosclerotiorum]KAJ5683351.1 hypothetical protein N7462_006516 [Penicillium macrosclerotiorum]